MSSRFERVASETKYEGKIFSVVEETFRHEDGEDSTREIVRHQGAVGVVTHEMTKDVAASTTANAYASRSGTTPAAIGRKRLVGC